MKKWLLIGVGVAAVWLGGCGTTGGVSWNARAFAGDGGGDSVAYEDSK